MLNAQDISWGHTWTSDLHFACPNSMQICTWAWIYHWTKTSGKSGLGLRAIAGRGPLGHRGPWATRPLGRRAAGPWWATGLLLAKPPLETIAFQNIQHKCSSTNCKPCCFQLGEHLNNSFEHWTNHTEMHFLQCILSQLAKALQQFSLVKTLLLSHSR